jgi:hypothetical protein
MRARIIDRTLYLVDKETYLIIYVIMLFREIDFVHFFQPRAAIIYVIMHLCSYAFLIISFEQCCYYICNYAILRDRFLPLNSLGKHSLPTNLLGSPIH